MKSIAFAVLLLCAALPWERALTIKGLPKSDENKTIVIMGDSIIGSVKGEYGAAAAIAEKTGCNVIDVSIGGTLAVSLNKTERNDYFFDFYSFDNLSRSLAYRDFTTIRLNIGGDRYETAEEMSKIMQDTDLGKVDYLLICYGVNDYRSGVVIEGKDAFSYKGALSGGVSRIKKAYPNIKIIIMSPTFCVITKDGKKVGGADVTDCGGGVLPDYVNAAKEVAEETGSYFYDAYHGLGINADNIFDYCSDGTHFLSEKGVRHLSDGIADYLNEYVLEDKS